RRVEITGEAYFEVNSHPVSPTGGGVAIPFIVAVRGEEVQVLGMYFNVDAYGDDAEIKTTLLEGSVSVGNKILQPGEQAIQKEGEKIVVKKVDVKDAVAWKNGFFAFTNASLSEVM